MTKDKSVMSYESVLPSDFDGVFRFSNPSDEDFIGIWGSKQYLFPAGTTTPLVIAEHSPLEVQHIRKKFAKDLAEREFYKSKGYKHQLDREGSRTKNGMWQPTGYGMSHAGTYTIKDLEPYIQECLKPLPASKLLTKPVEREPLENIIHRKDDGSLNTEAIDQKTSLRKKALES